MRHSEGGGGLFFRWRGRWYRGRGRSDLLGALPVFLCSWAWCGSGASRGEGWVRGWVGVGGWVLVGARSRGRSRTRTLGVVHVLSSRTSVRLPMGVVVLFGRGKQVMSVKKSRVWNQPELSKESQQYLLKLGCPRRMWIQRGVFRRGGVLIIRRLLLIRLLADTQAGLENRTLTMTIQEARARVPRTPAPSLPLQDKVHKLWPMSCERCESAPGSSRWRSRCSELEVTSCCRCTEGSQYKASSPARPLTTPPPRSTSVSGHHYSADESVRISKDYHTCCGLVLNLSFLC